MWYPMSPMVYPIYFTKNIEGYIRLVTTLLLMFSITDRLHERCFDFYEERCFDYRYEHCLNLIDERCFFLTT